MRKMGRSNIKGWDKVEIKHKQSCHSSFLVVVAIVVMVVVMVMVMVMVVGRRTHPIKLKPCIVVTYNVVYPPYLVNPVSVRYCWC